MKEERRRWREKRGESSSEAILDWKARADRMVENRTKCEQNDELKEAIKRRRKEKEKKK